MVRGGVVEFVMEFCPKVVVAVGFDERYFRFERRDDGTITISREVFSALRIKISWGLITP